MGDGGSTVGGGAHVHSHAVSDVSSIALSSRGGEGGLGFGQGGRDGEGEGKRDSAWPMSGSTPVGQQDTEDETEEEEGEEEVEEEEEEEKEEEAAAEEREEDGGDEDRLVPQFFADHGGMGGGGGGGGEGAPFGHMVDSRLHVDLAEEPAVMDPGPQENQSRGQWGEAAAVRFLRNLYGAHCTLAGLLLCVLCLCVPRCCCVCLRVCSTCVSACV